MTGELTSSTIELVTALIPIVKFYTDKISYSTEKSPEEIRMSVVTNI